MVVTDATLTISLNENWLDNDGSSEEVFGTVQRAELEHEIRDEYKYIADGHGDDAVEREVVVFYGRGNDDAGADGGEAQHHGEEENEPRAEYPPGDDSVDETRVRNEIVAYQGDCPHYRGEQQDSHPVAQGGWLGGENVDDHPPGDAKNQSREDGEDEALRFYLVHHDCL